MAEQPRILVVDDNRDGANSLALLLQAMGHDTRTAHDGLEAVEAATTFRPEVMLLDIGLPRLNGYEVARRIRAQPWGAHMVLIAQTGWGQEEDKQRTFEAGFNHQLTKPVTPVALEKLLAEAGYRTACTTRAGLNDCLYVVLAEREGCELVTDDQKLLNSLGSQYPFIIPLSSI